MSKQDVCPLCGEGKLVSCTKSLKRSYKGHQYHIDQPGDYCMQCGDGIISPEQRKATLKDIQAHKSRIDGLLTPNQVRRVRKKLGLNQRQASEIFGGGVNAFSRYERGEIGLTKPLSILLSILDQNPSIIEQYIPQDWQNQPGRRSR